MKRKIFVFLATLALCSPLAYAVSADAVSQALQQAADSAKPLKIQHSSSAHEKGVLMIKLTVDAAVNSNFADNDPLVKECPVVRISSHYLMGSWACVGLSEQATIRHYGGAGGGDYYTYPNVHRWIENAIINGQVVSKDQIFSSKENKIFLIRIDPDNAALKKAIQNKPAVNIFAPKDPQVLTNQFSNVQLNRERLCTSGRTCAEVEIATVCTETGCFRLAWKMIDGDSGDPIFGLLPDRSTEEFLLGFNITDVIGKHSADERRSGRNYSFFDRAKLESFLRSVMEEESASDWKQVQNKLVSEDYFLNN